MTSATVDGFLPAGVGEELVIDAVGHTYGVGTDHPVPALDATDLVIEAGAFVCIVGPSGCGKSTLLEILAGLRRPTAGQVRLGGRTVIGPGRRRGGVFKQASSLFPWRTVAGNVGFGLELQGRSRSARRERVQRELTRVGLSDFADRPVYELSGGMQQRCQIARALANDPDVLLLDEPFGALDTFTRELLQEQLRGIWRESRPTIVFITHSVEEAALLSTRVLVMGPRPGRIVRDFPVDFTHRAESAARLRSEPDFVQFCARLRTAIGPLESSLEGSAGDRPS